MNIEEKKADFMRRFKALPKMYFLFLIAVSLCTGRHSNEEYCFINLCLAYG